MKRPISSACLQSICIVAILLLDTATVSAGEIGSELIYRSPEERREAGLKRQLNEWLVFSGLVELEYVYETMDYVSNIPAIDSSSNTKTLQLGLEAQLSEGVQLVTVYEIERSQNKSRHDVDEMVLIAVLDRLEIEAGRLTVPFGEFYSHFITDPVLAFAEKRDDSVVVTYGLTDNIDVALYVAKGRVTKADGSETDWGVNIELRNGDESVKTSIAYLSDLSDTDEMLLQDVGGVYQRRVSAIDFNMLVGFENYELTVEYIAATDSFVELPADRNRPSSVNVEFAYYPEPDIQLAARLERSDEVEEGPAQRSGFAATFVFQESMTLSIEYLHGSFDDNFVVDDNDDFFSNSDIFSAQFNVVF